MRAIHIHKTLAFKANIKTFSVPKKKKLLFLFFKMLKKKADQVDPQSLFQQFSPTLHFESCKASSKDQYFIVGEQVVPVARDAYWDTIVRMY